MRDTKHTIKLYGDFATNSYCESVLSLKDVYESNKLLLHPPEFHPMFANDWETFLASLQMEIRKQMYNFNDSCLFSVDNQFIGGSKDCKQWLLEKFDYENYRPASLVTCLARDIAKEFFPQIDKDYAYMEITHGENVLGIICIEFFDEKVKNAVENFKILCSGSANDKYQTRTYSLAYQDSAFHRVIPNGWVQGGDITEGKGNGGISALPISDSGIDTQPSFPDENFSIEHDRPGIVGMANSGRNTNASQFYITLQPQPWMDNRYQALGRVVSGGAVLKAMSAVDTLNQRPIDRLAISRCVLSRFLLEADDACPFTQPTNQDIA